ncbi:MAG: B12-binding domain-containing protein [Thermoleophilia bacterium]|nr:B12-binding domain-containing protein [Thermoleophilia bacterium]
MTENDILEAAKQAVVAADEEKAIEVARQAVALGLDPLRVINEGFTPGMRQVGDLFERGTMFLPEVIIASEAMVAAVAILEENLPAEQKEKQAGIAVLGTIEGDVHDIGKGIVATLMRVYGFKVHDLGRDVPLQRFVDEAKSSGAQLVGSSALMTTTMVGQKQLEKLLKEAGIREQVKTMVGGAVVTQYWADKIGADAYAENAQEAVAKALELVEG